MTETATPTTALCANCAGGDGIEACRRDGGCSCACHLDRNRIEACEYETAPFTEAERAELARYNARIAGIPDCFDCPTLAGIPPEFSVGDVIGMFRAYYKLLDDWRDALRSLWENLAAHAEPNAYPYGSGFTMQPLSTAGRRYLQYEMTDYRQAREGHRLLISEYFLGHDEHGGHLDHATQYHGCELVDGQGFMFAEHP